MEMPSAGITSAPALSRGAGHQIPLTGAGTAERLLAEAAARLGRDPTDGRGSWSAFVLHLSRLRPPAPRPHHLRVARTLLELAGRHHEGQIFALGNGDMVLLSHAPGLVQGHVATTDGEPLAATLLRLLSPDAGDPATLISAWRLPASRAALIAYAAERLEDRPDRPAPLPIAGTGITAVLAHAELLASAGRLGELLDQHVTIRFVPSDRGTLPRPAHRSLGFSPAALAARLGSMPSHADPFLMRHLAASLDPLLLGALTRAIGSLGPLDTAIGPPLHLRLALPTLLGAGFAEWARNLPGRSRITLGVPLIDVGADPAGFADAANRLTGTGMTLALTDIGHHALILTDIAALSPAPGTIRLAWSPGLAAMDPMSAMRLGAAIVRLGPERIVLDQAGDAAALRWGLARRIARFAGPAADSLLAATRLAACPSAGDCTRALCATRAATVAPAARRLCANPALLAAGTP